jgi:hypothetical protein
VGVLERDAVVRVAVGIAIGLVAGKVLGRERIVQESANNIVKEAEKIQEQAEKIKGDITQATNKLTDLLLQQRSAS